MGTYHRGYFSGWVNINLKLITCEDKIFIPSIVQIYILNWYHTYILHIGMDITEAMIFQYFYWPGIRKAIQKEVTNCDTCQHTKRSNIKYGKLPAKEAEEIPRSKLCLYIIGPYVIIRKGQREHLNLKYVTMIDPLTGWFKITQYDEKKSDVN